MSRSRTQSLEAAERILRTACGPRLRLGFPLAPLTSFRLGGPAALYVEAESDADLAAVAEALDSTFRLIEGCLDRWTPDMVGDLIHRDYDGNVQVHHRGSILQRLFSHEAYHCGELSQTLGIAGLPQIDLWRPD